MFDKLGHGNVSAALHIARAVGVAESETWGEESRPRNVRLGMRVAHYVAVDDEAARAWAVAAPMAYQHRAGDIEERHIEDCRRIAAACGCSGKAAEIEALLDDLAATMVDLF